MTVTGGHRAIRRLVTVLAVVVAVGDLVVIGAVETPERGTWPVVGPIVEAVVSPRYLLLVAALVLLGSARGLLRGQRVASAVVLGIALATVPFEPPLPGQVVFDAAHLLLIVALVAGWSAFAVRSDPQRHRRGLAVLAGGLGVTLVYGTVGLYLLDSQFDSSTTFGESLVGSGRLLFLLPIDTINPTTRRGAWFIGSVRVMAVLVVLTAVTLLLVTVVERERQRRIDRLEVERILQRWATTSVAPFQLLDDKTWIFSPDREAFIGYKVVGRVAVALGAPIGEPAAAMAVLDAFGDRCRRNGWVPAFHQVDQAGFALLRSAGFKGVKVGEEAIVDVAGFDLDSPGWKSVRSALRRVERAGFRVRVLTPPIDDGTLAELRRVSDAWLASGGRRERTFTLGRFDEDNLRSCPIVVVADAAGGVAAFANLVPSYRSDNGNFDLMRRRPDAPNGVMDALHVGLIEHFRRHGAAGLTLGLAPLARIQGPGLAEHALRQVHIHADRAFHFRGLWQFKAKWQPRWEPRYSAYRTDAELPAVAVALVRVGELPRPHRLRATAQHVVRTYPFSVALAALVTWFMTATAVSRGTFTALLRRFGLAWRDLLHLELWRLPTSQLLQPHPGFVWTNVVLIVALVPWAERRLGTWRTAATFFFGDWISTILVLIGIRLSSGLGYAHAHELLRVRDSGASSGTWALAAAIAWTLPRGRVRTTAVVGVFTVLAGALVVDHRLFDLQHLLAAVGAIALVEVSHLRRGSGTPDPASRREGEASMAAS